MRYLQGTTDMGLIFDKAKMENSIIGFVDSDYAGDLDKRRLSFHSLRKRNQLEGNFTKHSCIVYHKSGVYGFDGGSERGYMVTGISEGAWHDSIEDNGVLRQSKCNTSLEESGVP